jgi:CRISPR/Cas system-associated exonuclease Cas4 (RecB family)
MDQELDERLGLPSASRMDADMRCLGRQNICKKCPPEKSSKAAVRGQDIHFVLDGTKKLDTLSKSDQITAQRIMHEEARLVEKYHFEGAKVLVEERLWMVGDDMKPNWSGRVDRAHIKEGRAFVPDYKTGWNAPVAITDNWQVRSQAVLVAFHHDVTEITSALIHPNHPENIISQVIVFSEKELNQFACEIQKMLAEMQKPDAPRTPNEISCEYCPAKAMCPEFNRNIEKVLPATPEQIVRPNLESMSPDDRGKRLALFKIVEKLIKEERETCKSMLKKDPLSVAGWKLRIDEMREIQNDKLAFFEMKKVFGEEWAIACMKFSITEATNVLIVNGCSKEESKAKLADILGDNIQSKPKEASLREA